MDRQLAAIRDSLLERAALREGERVLDAGAGTGLLVNEARSRVGAAGTVLALDLSRGALSEIPAAPSEDAAPAHPVVGAVEGLPFRDESVDAVLTRSVLVYVGDKLAVAREFHRVLRGNGRAVLFEPINRVSAAHLWTWGLDLSRIQPNHDRVLRHLDESWEGRAAMMDFDERDLVDSFWEAGFQSVSLQYEYTRARGVRAPQLLSAWLRNRQTGTQLSYEEAAREVLGDDADEHLRSFDEILSDQAAEVLFAHAWLTARR